MVNVSAERELDGVFSDPSSGYTVKRVDELELAITASEVVFLCIDVTELEDKTFFYVNKDSVSHLFMVYASPVETKPETLADPGVADVSSGGITVNAGISTGSMQFNNNYRWLIVSVTGGGVKANGGDIYFQGSR